MNFTTSQTAPRLSLVPDAKRYFRGTHRVLSPEETFERALPIGHAIGVTRIANVTGLDVIGIPVFTAMRPTARSLCVSQGKGVTAEAAKASALMESIELFHAENVSCPVRIATLRAMRREAEVVFVEDLPMAGNRPLDPEEQLLWVQGVDLFSAVTTWVPLEVVHTNYTRELRSGYGVFAASSNGLASGNHLTEAILHALCEVIERDATSLWDSSSAGERERHRVDLATVRDVDCQKLLQNIVGAGLEVALWDTTSDVGVPAFCCIITEPEEASLYQMYAASGMGCHPDIYIALSRAITEAAQSRLTAIVGSRDDLMPSDYVRLTSLAPLARPRTESHESLPVKLDQSLRTNSVRIEEDVNWVLGKLASAGIKQVVMVDLTDERFNLPVVRIVVPGLEGPTGEFTGVPGARARGKSK